MGNVAATAKIFVFLSSLPIAYLTSTANAQPIADDSLPHNSEVVLKGNMYQINGGTIADKNLFHSFENFSVPEGKKVFFNNDLGIENIVTRVTGNSASNIDGVLETSGNANLFLLNPNGIFFGSNSSLNIGGSFLATTADSLIFSDGTKFSSGSNTAFLLTISVPVGLQFGNKVGDISNESGQLFNPGGAIALIGGNVNLQGGTILSSSPGNIELGSVGRNSQVNFNSTERGWIFDYQSVEIFRNITLTQAKISVDRASDFPAILIGSDISLNGQEILISDGKQIIVSDNLQINSDILTIKGSGLSPQSGIPAFSGLVSATFDEADGGDISLNTDRLILQEGGLISSEVSFDFEINTGKKTLATGNGGHININATESILLRDESQIFSSTEGFGSAGNIRLETKKLTVSEGAEVSVGASGLGSGSAGNLEILASSIVLDQGILSAETNAGNKGNITISNTGTLLLRNNSRIVTDATKKATGGNINIDSEGILLIENSNITARAVEGRGGNINIKTQGLFQEPNSTVDASSQKNIDGTITIQTPETDPTSSIIKLPDIPIDAEAILAQNICHIENGKIAKGSSFVITGRGGLTPTSEDALDNVNNVVGWANRDEVQVSSNGFVGVRQRPSDNFVIQQSQGWVTTSDGSVWLIPKCGNF